MLSRRKMQEQIYEFLNSLNIGHVHSNYWSQVLSKPAVIIVVIFTSVLTVFNLFPGLRSYLPLAQESNYSSETLVPNIITGNYAVGNTGPVTQVIGTSTKPRLTYIALSEPLLHSDGFYHTTYELTFWDGTSEVAPETFRFSNVFVRCLSTSFVGMQLRPSPGLVNSVECLSKERPAEDQILFWI